MRTSVEVRQFNLVSTRRSWLSGGGAAGDVEDRLQFANAQSRGQPPQVLADQLAVTSDHDALRLPLMVKPSCAPITATSLTGGCAATWGIGGSDALIAVHECDTCVTIEDMHQVSPGEIIDELLDYGGAGRFRLEVAQDKA